MFCSLYPGSGPEIVARFPSIVPTTPESLKTHSVVEGDAVGAELGMSDNGWYDTTEWTVRDELASAKKKNAFEVSQQLGEAMSKMGNFFSDVGEALGRKQKISGGEIGVGVAPPPFPDATAATTATPAAAPAAAGGGRAPQAASSSPSLPASPKVGGSASPRDPIPVPPTSPKPAPAAAKPPLPAAKVLGTALAPAPLRRDNKVVGERRNEQFYDEMFFSEEESGGERAFEMSGLYNRQSEHTGENEMQPKR